MKKIWCIPPKASADFVCAMEDMLAVYQRDFDDGTVLVCADETPEQQTRETRTPLFCLYRRSDGHRGGKSHGNVSTAPRLSTGPS